MRLGLDIGSTTLKCVLLDQDGAILYKRYRRHEARIRHTLQAMLAELGRAVGEDTPVCVAISGSAGIGLAERLDIPFVQEVYATYLALSRRVPDADAAIELGGEDAKLLFLRDAAGHPALEARMNGACAGGTGAFIDQMAALLGVSIDQIDELARASTRTYAIASRCGVFAKSDIQPLVNQGAELSDIAASILDSVVNQTISGLAQGRKLGGRVVYLGGPLTFLPALRAAFDRAIGGGVCPEDSMYFVALGAALQGGEEMDVRTLLKRVAGDADGGGYQSCRPLFASPDEYLAFARRHAARGRTPEAPPEQDQELTRQSGEGFSFAARSGGEGALEVRRADSDAAAGEKTSRNVAGRTGIAPAAEGAREVYIGVDAGSTTIKMVAIDRAGRVLLSDYANCGGSPVPRVQAFLEKFYRDFPRARLAGSAATGYGEALIRRAFGLDMGVVETTAHFTAAKAFCPDVDFIIDIGGQDIKCLKIHNGAIDNIYLNEACSSGCGSFLQAFAGAWGLSMEEFVQKGLRADKPVDLGSRCTVFMNSSVKQAQKDGASIENISAGLSVSVVKNALYKVVRAANAEALGARIVVQGGTFLNDAVLRAFEMEVGREVVRPAMAALMGAYGAALLARDSGRVSSGALTIEGLKAFHWTSRTSVCPGCANRCTLTRHDFGGGRDYISGNRCQKPLGRQPRSEALNLYAEKRAMLAAYGAVGAGKRGTIGIPLGLNMYELLPFWHTLWTRLGFAVVVSPPSTREAYLRGQYTIPSDTVCYPAKILHGHVEDLIERGVEAIFYPCMSYNFDEGKGDNHFNCPVVAYYPEVIRGNVPARSARFLCDYLGPHKRRAFPGRFARVVKRYFPDVRPGEVRAAAREAYAEYDRFMARVRARGREILESARAKGLPVVILAGRPYHIDEEICHGLDRLLGELGAAVVSEDAVCGEGGRLGVDVLNQWTYHARLYEAARYVAQSNDPNLNLVQLVSFGCGVDAITSDETRAILEEAGRVYTQIKIDEIANLGAARIRLRSLFAAAGWKEEP